jgi:adenosylmethionine-8-amino-7-oxononanoate aminotransferase
MTSSSDSEHLQLESFWMPFTANRQFKAAPRMFASAEGMYYTTEDGRKVLDGPPASGASMPATAAARSPRRSSAS